ERHARVGDRALAALDEDLLGAIGLEEHQVGARLERDGGGDVGVEALVDLVAGAGGADVDDVVVDLDRLVGLDVGYLDVELATEVRVGRRRGGEGEKGKGGQGDEKAYVHRVVPPGGRTCHDARRRQGRPAKSGRWRAGSRQRPEEGRWRWQCAN